MKQLGEFLKRLGTKVVDRAIDLLALAVLGLVVGALAVFRSESWDFLSRTVDLAIGFLLVLGSLFLSLPLLYAGILRRRRLSREPLSVQISVSPISLDIGPVGYSVASLTALVTDRHGRPVRNVKTDFFTDRGAVQPAGLSNQPARDYCWVKSDKAGRALARLLSSPQVGRAIPTPGVAMVSAQVPNESHVAQAWVVTITLIGPPASITVAAAPVVVAAGEAVTVTVTLKDAIGQNVWDGHKVRLTGGTFQDSEPVTFGGVATAFLHTAAPGVYTVVGTAPPTLPGWPPISALVTVTAK